MKEPVILELVDQLPAALILMSPPGEIILKNKSAVALEQKLKQTCPMEFRNIFWINKIQQCLAEGEIEFVLGTENLICKMVPTAKKPSMVWLSITETNNYLDQFTASQDMAQTAKIKAMSEMAAGIAHEINNPLTVIYAKTHFLREYLEKSENADSPLLLGHLNKIHHNAERIFKIVSGMRSYSRDSRQDPLIQYPVHKLVKEALALVNSQIQVLGVEVQVTPIAEDLTISCWPSQLLQVLLNLFKNAIDSMESFPFPKLNIAVETEGNKVLFYVSDSGPGVSLEDEKKIFLPFFTTKPVGLGTGIGLSISLKIIANHGGQLRLDRTRSNSCFVFEIPIQARAQKTG